MKIRIRHILPGCILIFILSSCDKSKEAIIPVDHPGNSSPQFIKYTIKAGQQFCDQTVYKQTDYNELKFIVKFDSSAIYQTASSNNQLDVNKLYGFSDNNDDHHHFSARFGWRWSEGSLHLFGYTYNNSVMSYEELGTIRIGIEYTCSIKINESNYIFSLDENSKTMPRSSTTPTAVGYRLYPYFGGDEAAPHEINIWIKEL
ncbi:MAG: hypothetical protein ACHQFX_02725 [Chitinophagales bacterium]